MSTIRALKPVRTSPNLSDLISLSLLYNIPLANADCKIVANHIHIVLLLNTLQRLVLEKVFDHVIQIKRRLCIMRKDQLLLYIKGEGNVRKSCVIHVLEMRFTLLARRNELMLVALMQCAAEGIEESTVYTVLSINTCKAKSLCINISKIWMYQSLLIINKLSMIYFRLLIAMDKQLRKAHGAIVFSTTLFSGLPLVILMGDFY